jgi:proteic killer suppression protein
VDVEFAKDDLERLYTDAAFEMGLPSSVVRAYRRRVQQITAAVDERDLRALKSLHMEKLKGKHAHQNSIRLNDQFRLIFELLGDGQRKRLLIAGVEDYH